MAELGYRVESGCLEAQGLLNDAIDALDNIRSMIEDASADYDEDSVEDALGELDDQIDELRLAEEHVADLYDSLCNSLQELND